MIRVVHPGSVPPDTNPDFLPILDSETRGQNANKKTKTCEQMVITRNNFCENTLDIFMTRFLQFFAKSYLVPQEV
jgi:hypothetical protein